MYTHTKKIQPAGTCMYSKQIKDCTCTPKQNMAGTCPQNTCSQNKFRIVLIIQTNSSLHEVPKANLGFTCRNKFRLLTSLKL